MRPVFQTIEVARQTAWLLLRNRMFLALAVLGVAATFTALGFPRRVFMSQGGDDLFGVPAYLIVFQFGLPIVATYFGLSAVHAEIADGSAVHAHAAPISRVSLVLGKWLAVSVLVALGGAVVVGAWWLMLSQSDRPWRRGFAPTTDAARAFVIAAALAAPAYAAVGTLVGATFKRPLVAAVIFIVGWEVAISNVPPQAGVRGLTIADPIRRFLTAALAPERDSDLAAVLESTLHGQDVSRLSDPVASIMTFVAVSLGAAVCIYARREYRFRSHGDE